MKTTLPKLGAFFALALLCGGQAAAQFVVNIDIDDNPGNNYSGQGAYSDPGHNFWNSVSTPSGGSSLLASDGTTITGISFSYSGAGGPGAVGEPSYAGKLLADYIYTGGTATFTIGGLTPGLTYQIYLYSQPGTAGSTDRAATFTVDGQSANLSGLNPGSLVQGSNYVVIPFTASGTLVSGTFAPNAGAGGGEAELNGLQLVVPVPEPSSVAALGGIVVLAAAAIQRRRRQSRV